MTLTHLQRRVLVDLSDGSWSQDFQRVYSAQALSRLLDAGLIRSDTSHGPLSSRNWTATQRGIDYIEDAQ
tara:strand:- start:1456 stop:1665 length:210 start_codon:yes stop_codon:yes gene_type:complete